MNGRINTGGRGEKGKNARQEGEVNNKKERRGEEERLEAVKRKVK